MAKQPSETSTSPATVLGTDDSFRLLVESVKDYAIVMLDPDGHVASWNAGAERIKGYRPDEIIGKHFSCFYPAEAIQRGLPEQELTDGGQGGAVRGRRLARAQGRHAVLGQRHHHGACATRTARCAASPK